MLHRLAILLPLLICAPLANAAQAQTFEVATVKPSAPDQLVHTVHLDFDHERYSATNCSLALLLQAAYGVDEHQISGIPKPLAAANYDIAAIMDAATYEQLRKLPDDQRELAHQHMLQTLLADRFHLTLHRETKDLPIYALTTAKHGSRLQQPALGNTYTNGAVWPGGNPMGPHNVYYEFIAGQVHIVGQQASIAQLVDHLTQKLAEPLGRPILDRTGLTGEYDFTLDFRVPWRTTYGATSLSDDEPQAITPDVSLFSALQEQLGLRLEATRGPVQLLVIDHIETPSPN